MDERAQREQSVAKFATVFLTIFALGFILMETFADQQTAAKIGVSFGVILALLGASMSEEQEAEAAARKGRQGK